jgi:hypothetical protein
MVDWADFTSPPSREGPHAEPGRGGARDGPPVGGVCPFGLARPLRVFCDVSLRAFDVVFPAAGAPDAAVRITPDRLALLTHAAWVDVMQDVAVAA